MSNISPLSMVELDCTLHAKRFHPQLVTGSDTGCCIAFLSRQCCSFRCWLLLWQIAFFAFGLFNHNLVRCDIGEHHKLQPNVIVAYGCGLTVIAVDLLFGCQHILSGAGLSCFGRIASFAIPPGILS